MKPARQVLAFLIAFSFAISSAWAKGGRVIDQLEPLDVNKTKQWLLYRGQDQSKPIVLFVHGGPGSPLMMFSRAFDDTFIKDFVIVHWDQRRSGKSFSADIPLETLTLEQIVRDGLVVVDHLKKKFHRSKLILVGHSWGSMVASHMDKARPDDFSMYVSVGTVADIAAADQLKFEFLKSKISSSADQQDAVDLKALGMPPYNSFDQIVIQSRLMWKWGGSFHKLSADAINAAVAKTKEYSPAELKAQGEGMKAVFEKFSPYLNTYRASKEIKFLDVPTVFVHGKFDMATPLELTKKFIDEVDIPKGKKLVVFEESSHFPMYEEPSRFLEVLKAASHE